MTGRQIPTWACGDGEQISLFEIPCSGVPAVPVEDAVVAAAELVIDAGLTVLPRTELSGIHGYPVVRWAAGVTDRLAAGEGPVLDSRTLSLWEFCPTDGPGAPPAAPLSIVGFVATGQWGRALYAASELRGFGETIVLTRRRPKALSLAAADLAGVNVVRTSDAGEELLVRGSKVADPPRIVAVRYWEERLFAHALATGTPVRPVPVPA